MEPKHYGAFLAILGSLCWFAMMTASQIETLTTPHTRFLFLIAFVVALLVGVFSLCFLFTQMYRKK